MSAKEAHTFDFASLDLAAKGDEGAELELTHPVTGEALGVFFTMAGADSKTWRRAVQIVDDKKPARRKVTRDAVEANADEIVARCTLGWRTGDAPTVWVDGEAVPCTVENARRFYARFRWARDQADAFASDRAEYLRD